MTVFAFSLKYKDGSLIKIVFVFLTIVYLDKAFYLFYCSSIINLTIEFQRYDQILFQVSIDLFVVSNLFENVNKMHNV